MDIYQLKERLLAGEDSGHQFKENFSSIDHLAAEITAFANSRGGRIIVGVNDKGYICGLSPEDIRRLNQWIANAASQKIEPPIFVRTRTLLTEQSSVVLIIEVPLGTHKPYCVNKSDFWVKNGADKRRATREELFRLMQSSSRLFADETLTDVSAADIDRLRFSYFYQTVFGEYLNESEIRDRTLLENLKLAKEGNLTLAGLMLFGKTPTLSKPQFAVKGTVYLSDDEFRDKEEIGGNLFEQHRRGTDFILRNLRRIQKLPDFNAPGELEIPSPAIKEAVANALAHRDYFIDAPVFINIFEDRVEVASPGVLPNTVTVENIRLGIHLERNPILLSFLAKDPDFGYTGRGSGIPRLLRLCRQKNVPVKLINDTERQMFRVLFERRP